MSETKDQALERRMVAAVKIAPTDGQYGLRHIVCGIEVGEARHAEVVEAARAVHKQPSSYFLRLLGRALANLEKS